MSVTRTASSETQAKLMEVVTKKKPTINVINDGEFHETYAVQIQVDVSTHPLKRRRYELPQR